MTESTWRSVATGFELALNFSCEELANTVGRLQESETPSDSFINYVSNILENLAKSAESISTSEDSSQDLPWVGQPIDVVAHIVSRVARAIDTPISEAWEVVDDANRALGAVRTGSSTPDEDTQMARDAALKTVSDWISTQLRSSPNVDQSQGAAEKSDSQRARSAAPDPGNPPLNSSRSILVRKVLGAIAITGVLAASYIDLALAGSLTEVQVLLTASLTAYVAQRASTRGVDSRIVQEPDRSLERGPIGL